LFDPGYPVIDATLAKDGDKCYLFFKDERGGTRGINSAGGKKNIHSAQSNGPEGPWKNISAAIFGDSSSDIFRNAAEGPELIKVGKYWHLYMDLYRQNKFALFISESLDGPWERVRWKLRMPPGAQHGSFLKVKFADIEGLKP